MSPAIDLPHRYSGKVRDMYDAGDGRLLLVTSDRISAFDVVMAEPITNKGRVLTAMSAFWFDHFADVVGSHLISTDLADLPAGAQDPELAGRVMLCHEAERVVAPDNTVTLGRHVLRIAPQPGRRTCAGLRVLVRRHLDGSYTITRGPTRLARYNAQGQPVDAAAPVDARRERRAPTSRLDGRHGTPAAHKRPQASL